ncbi:hypothetical protein E6C70_09715 [Glaciibacter flavus]|uniref:Deoxyribonuclease NucA/NucB domain-containing protein n=1 Tax=Orlajensenia flava TaxID=2565934 RepID=A0A4S4FWN4_9MICO|nr:hypothetical protein [Glaciibacter flavus]THG34522.1 hypothetical protein E6C70_09715 [Glaciibacter flavus]
MNLKKSAIIALAVLLLGSTATPAFADDDPSAPPSTTSDAPDVSTMAVPADSQGLATESQASDASSPTVITSTPSLGAPCGSAPLSAGVNICIPAQDSASAQASARAAINAGASAAPEGTEGALRRVSQAKVAAQPTALKTAAAPADFVESPLKPAKFKSAPYFCFQNWGEVQKRRFEQCEGWEANVSLVRYVDDVPEITGTARLEIINYAYTFKSLGQYNEQIEVDFISGTGDAANGLHVTGIVFGGRVYNEDEVVSEDMTVSHPIKAQKALQPDDVLAPGVISTGFGLWSLHLQSPGYNEGYLNSPQFTFRCDNTLKKQSAGCVTPDYVPGMFVPDVNTWTHHLALASASGLRGFSEALPIHFLQDQAAQSRNRKQACKGNNLPAPAGYTCDEYPFASVYEGANSTAAKAAGPRSFAGCYFADSESFGLDGFSHCMINGVENTAGGHSTATFYLKQRIIDGDGFYVILGE